MKSLGDSYEQWAAHWIEQKGLQIVSRNYRCKLGEIDLIACDRGQLVFVEVRARSISRYARAPESVDQRKQDKLRRTALHYLLQRYQTTAVHCRFDVVAIEPRQSPDNPAVRWIRSAF